MAVSKSQKIQAEIDKVKAKISEQQARLKELEQKKLEAENSEIVCGVKEISGTSTITVRPSERTESINFRYTLVFPLPVTP